MFYFQAFLYRSVWVKKKGWKCMQRKVKNTTKPEFLYHDNQMLC